MDKQRENSSMSMNVEKRHSWLLAASGLLFVAICVSVALLASILKGHTTSDKDAIALVPVKTTVNHIVDAQTESVAGETEVVQGPGEQVGSASQSGNKVTTNGSQTSQTQANHIGVIESIVHTPLNPGMEVYDNLKTWETLTEVDIFKLRYENGEGVVTVEGGSDKVIAPGTENTYTFNLKNTGNVQLDYTMEIEAYFNQEDHPLPVVARLKGYDGNYLLGGEDQWCDVLELNAIKDEATIGVNRYAYYTLEWQWPFESGNDEYDTFLGNMAVGEDLTLTIVIRTLATGEDMTTEVIKVPADKITTGDAANLLIWAGAAAVAGALLLLIIFKKRREKEELHEED